MKPLPDLLLVEDDPTSQAFLAAVLKRVPAQVHVAGDSAAAIALARDHPHAVWLVDAHLPDGSGIGLLRALRAIDASGIALAHTASTDAGLHAQLRTAGFIDVLVKPLPADVLLAAVRSVLAARAHATVDSVESHTGASPGRAPQPEESSGGLPVWDREAASRAVGGQQAHIEALRSLFLAELPGSHTRIREAVLQQDDATLRAELHRLHASCGFVGATRLASAARALQDAPGHYPLRGFEAAVEATLAPMDLQDGGCCSRMAD